MYAQSFALCHSQTMYNVPLTLKMHNHSCCVTQCDARNSASLLNVLFLLDCVYN
eukprot:m.244284 g.244284  ORF g.244284 m.244284 type:complete len:54 (+) comp19470_c0_seq4:44-205(+)